MEKKVLEQFKKTLEERQRVLRESVSRTEQDGRTADVSDSAQDIADRASSSYQKEFLFHQSNNDRQLLLMVDGALDRIRQGSLWRVHLLRERDQWQASASRAVDALLHFVSGEAGERRASGRGRQVVQRTASALARRMRATDQMIAGSPSAPTATGL